MTAGFLQVKNIVYHYPVGRKKIKALDGISLALKREGTLGIVGESGSGKSTLGKTIAGLLAPQRGAIVFKGLEISGKMNTSVQYVFQNSSKALNPRMRVRDLIAEGLIIQKKWPRKRDLIIRDVMDAVGLPERVASYLPGQLSGGQIQRVALARVLAVEPEVLILDEPVSSLDVTTGAMLLLMLAELRKKKKLSYIIISHDLAVLRQTCTDIAVIYAGKIVEAGRADYIFTKPRHMYTKMLLAAHPQPDPAFKIRVEIRREAADPLHLPSGCRFHTRCPEALPLCRRQPPGMVNVAKEHCVSCHLAG